MDVKKLFLEHFEKLALAIAAGVLALFIVTTLVREQPADAERVKVEKANREIAAKVELANRNAPKPEKLTTVRDVLIALEGGTGTGLPVWLYHRRPVIVTRIEGIDVPEPKAFAPTLEQPKSGLGRISLSWSDSSSNNLVKVDRYDLYRAEGSPDAKNWKKIQSFDASKSSYIDKDVHTKTSYFYKIECFFSVDGNHPSVKTAMGKGAQVELPPEMRQIASAGVGPITTKTDQHLEVISVTLKSSPQDIKDGKPPQKASAYLKVWKYFPERKEWLPQQYTEVKVDEPIGKVEQVAKDKRDFTTDYKLVATKKVPTKKKLPTGEEIDGPEADTIECIDTKTGETVFFDNVNLDPGLVDVKKNPKVADDTAAPDDKSKDDKSK